MDLESKIGLLAFIKDNTKNEMDIVELRTTNKILIACLIFMGIILYYFLVIKPKNNNELIQNLNRNYNNQNRYFQYPSYQIPYYNQNRYIQPNTTYNKRGYYVTEPESKY